MKIVVEGFDGTGKGTLIDALRKHFRLQVLIAGGPPPSQVVAIQNCLDQIVIRHVIHDRITPISRLCYQLDLSEDEKLLMEGLLMQFTDKSTFFIHCIGKGQHIAKSHDDKEHLSFIDKNDQIIRDNYNQLFSHLNHFEYDFNKHTVKEVVNAIFDHFGIDS